MFDIMFCVNKKRFCKGAIMPPIRNRVKAFSLKSDNGISVRQEFFAPDIGMEPESLFPPSMKIFSFN